MDIGNRITQLRLKNNLSTNKLANIAGLSQSYVRSLELNEKTPSIESLSYLCDALEITLTDFFNESYIIDIETDPLIQRIKKLNSKQRDALLLFLDTIIDNGEIG